MNRDLPTRETAKHEITKNEIAKHEITKNEIAKNEIKKRPRRWRRFLGDERGNLSMLFVLGFLLLVALIYSVLVGGQRLVQKEVIANSADAAALAGAIVRAKALNFIAFTNLVMAAVLALMLVFKALALGIGGAALATLCPSGVCAGLGPPQYEAAAAALEAELGQLAAGERAVAAMAPSLALVEAYRAGTDPVFRANYGSGLATEAVPAAAEPLPVSDDSAADFVAQARARAGDAAAIEVAPGALPLRLDDDWRARRFFRARSWLSRSNATWRARIAGVGVHGSVAPPSEQTEAAAQAEFFAFYGHEDLWHINWRARLSLSRPFVAIPSGLDRYWVH